MRGREEAVCSAPFAVRLLRCNLVLLGAKIDGTGFGTGKPPLAPQVHQDIAGAMQARAHWVFVWAVDLIQVSALPLVV